MENFDQQLDSFDHHHEVKKQVEMYFDRALDPESTNDLLQKVNSNPSYLQIFEHEQHVRDQLKRYTYRPDNSSQLLLAIKNQILNSGEE
jgi:hypothetical protein